jgi:hypothetical protein
MAYEAGSFEEQIIAKGNRIKLMAKSLKSRIFLPLLFSFYS